MNEHPIIFSAPMIRAILEGSKTQTRRVIKPQPPTWERTWTTWDTENIYLWTPRNPLSSLERAHHVKCPYAPPGDRLWVRETFSAQAVNHLAWPDKDPWWHEIPRSLRGRKSFAFVYYAAGETEYVLMDDGTLYDNDSSPLRNEAGKLPPGFRWSPSIFMPRWASRLTLEVLKVRVEQVQEISEEDAEAEGFERREHFIQTWDKLNTRRGYEFAVNPWVWVVTFRQIQN